MSEIIATLLIRAGMRVLGFGVGRFDIIQTPTGVAITAERVTAR